MNICSEFLTLADLHYWCVSWHDDVHWDAESFTVQRQGQCVISGRSRVDAALLLLVRQVHQCKASATLLEAAGVLVDFHFEVNLGAGEM